MKIFSFLAFVWLQSATVLAQQIAPMASSAVEVGSQSWSCAAVNQGRSTWACAESVSGKKIKLRCQAQPATLQKMGDKTTLKKLYAACEVVVPVPPN